MVDLVWLASADTLEWPPFADLLGAFWSEVIPGERPIPVSELLAEVLFSPKHRRVLALLARSDDRPVAVASLVMDDPRPKKAGSSSFSSRPTAEARASVGRCSRP
jgi:hypothetical protein